MPSIGPADPKLRAVPLPGGKTLHLLPATLETTQWGWFDNAQAPVLRIDSGDTVVLETMMHPTTRSSPARPSSRSRSCAPTSPAADRTP